MPIVPGTKIGPYEILSPLGEGGMGAVYKAHDPTLQRTVAIKVLAKQDEDASARLLQEARAASALNHPHICTIHEVGEHEGQAFIVMEHVEGKPLSALIPADGLPPESVIRYGTQIADALAHAHERGIVHRDLKSQNVVITPEGRAKVLDFGLAARMPQADAEAVTKTQDAIPHAGMLVGTLAYMAPEVLRGEAATARSDIWALGVVLYEMASGKPPFGGDTAADVASATLKETPATLPSRVSAGLRSIIHKCLAKDAGQRYTSAAVVQGALDVIQSDSAVSQPAGIAPAGGTWTWRVTSAVLGLVLVAGGLGYWLRPDTGPATASRSPLPRLTNPVQITSASGVEDHPSWSPDGRTIAYSATGTGGGSNWDIWMRQIGGERAVNRTLDSAGDDRFPVWSPDGTQLAFWSDREGPGYYVMSVLAGGASKVSEVLINIAYGPAQWSPDGSRLAHVNESAGELSLEIVTLRTGEREQYSLPGTQLMRGAPSWSPDGRLVAYVDAPGIALEANTHQLRVLDLETEEVTLVTDGQGQAWSPTWSPDGRTLFFVSNKGGTRDLWMQRLRPAGALEGSAERLTTGVGMRWAALSAAGDRLVYSQGRLVSNLWRVPIFDDRAATWDDAEQLTFDQARVEYYNVSPDGSQLLFNSDRNGNSDLWSMPVDGGELRQLTTDPADDFAPMLSPDGREVVFYSMRSGNRDLWVMPASGGSARRLTQNPAWDGFPSWSPDGSQIAFISMREAGFGLWVMPADGGEPRKIANNSTGIPHWSKDGNSIAYVAFGDNFSRVSRVAVGGGDPDVLSTGAARSIVPSRDGEAIYFHGVTTNTGSADGVWALSLVDGTERRLTNLLDRRGNLGTGLGTDGQYLYFTWQEDLGDIWVMDVVTDNADGSDD